MTETITPYYKDGKLTIQLRVKCPKAKSFNKGLCPDNYVSWVSSDCKHLTMINEVGECSCIKGCWEDEFIAKLAFNCRSSAH